MQNRWISSALGGVLGLAPVALAHAACEIYVDGIPVQEQAVVQLTGVDVAISSDGAIHITTPRSRLDLPQPQSVVGNSATPALKTSEADEVLQINDAPNGEEANRALQGRYWLAVQELGTTSSEWNVRVMLNDQLVGTFASGDTRVVEVTGSLRHGANVARLEFRRSAHPGHYQSRSADDVFQVVLAPGHVRVDQDQISLEYPIFTIRRDATQVQSSPEELRFILPPPVRP